MRIPVSNREAASYVIMRRKGQSFNAIAKFWGRSTSVVWRRIQKLRKYHKGTQFKFAKCFYDLRKMPDRLKHQSKRFKRRILERLRESWVSWVLGEGDEPP